MRVLITGIGGFAGGHLAEYLSTKKDVQIFGLRRGGSDKKPPVKAELVSCDMRDPDCLEPIFERIKPDRIFHLAASASVGQSWKDPEGVLSNNIGGTATLLETVRRHCHGARVHIAGSGEIYGRSMPGSRLNEASRPDPLNPYAQSKAAQEKTALRFHKEFGIHVVCTRAFNHFGPRQAAGFVAADWAKQIAMIEAGKKEPVMRVGDLTPVRDFSDVRDVVQAYWLCLEKGKSGEVYNVCTGQGRRVSELLDSYLGQAAVKIKAEQDPALLRKNDAPELVGDPEKFKKATGWTPAIPFEKTVKDVLDHWRKEVRA